MSKESPVLFNGAMVRAILAGQKTQTRRAVKGEALGWLAPDKFTPEYVADPANHMCPFGQPRDRLWVRESFWGCDMPGYGDQPCVVYDSEWIGNEYAPAEARPWARKFGRIPAIHMPRDACRLLLEIADVRAERLQEMPSADWEAEGVSFCMEDPSTAAGHAFNKAEHYAIAGVGIRGTPEDHGMRAQFAEQGLDWDSNPWVWVISFKVLAA